MRLLLLVPLVSCCITSPAQSVAVREAQVRSPRCGSDETCTARSHPLPLNAASHAAILMFLTAGGNNDNIDSGQVTTSVYPDADSRWGELLTKLESDANLDFEDLTNGTYSKWFEGTPIRQVIDARDDVPALACQPHSVQNERFTWIFTCGTNNKLGGLLIQLAPGKREE